ncbi:MAG: pentapeptide repeat-containing protein [Bacteroidales bacterium]|nr:pentapeptide repeat-containing protein [Clostridium sp.]MCM1204964.1 pentapeptide repeat-containing protein [Bacteroidales bacterium]
MHNIVMQADMDELKEGERLDFRNAYITADIRKNFTRADFSGVRFHDIRMEGAVFTECDFSEATIMADITNVKFIRCNFDKATFIYAHVHASVMQANSFQQTQFVNSSIRGTEISGNNFKEAKMDEVDMSFNTSREANIHIETIQYESSETANEELERMKESGISEVSGQAYRESEQVNVRPPEEKIVMELTPGEMLMIKKCIREFWDRQPVGTWQSDLMHSLRLKVDAAYQKPVMTQDEFQQALLKEKESWMEEDTGNPRLTKALAEGMVEMKGEELRFYYQIETEHNYDAAIEEALEAAEVQEAEFEMEM